MTDGTTATISPVGENEMQQAKTIFERMAEAVVQATSLVPKIEEMRRELDSLQGMTADLRRRNTELDEFLSNVRTQRDEARAELEKAKSSLSLSLAQNEGLTSRSQSQEQVISNLNQSLEQVQKERDDWMKSFEKSDQDLILANDKLAQIAKLFPAMPMPQAASEPPKAPEPIYPPGTYPSEATQAPSPEPTQAQPEPTRAYQGEPGYRANDDRWDNDRQKWYTPL